ncbi:hypothetical protein ATCC90586_010832 [Pythium insidiosum]|nr:hypothetical protein ATCC90586_010832 [Pythium insidiosum]
MFALQLAMYGWVVTEYIVVAQGVPRVRVENETQSTRSAVYEVLTPLPVVLMHGMGDAAGHSGMLDIRDRIAKQLGSYTVNIAIGDTVEADTKNSFFMTMDDQVKVFAEQVRKLIGEAVYSDQVQSKFLPDINNERSPPNATYKANFVKLRSLVLVRAKKDTQVFPKDSEWFGGFRDGTYEDILGFNETRWYKEDLFGLQTLHNSGKIHFLETDGNHLQFSTHFLLDVVDKYFMTTLA